jgi:uncharacterized membrane protein
MRTSLKQSVAESRALRAVIIFLTAFIVLSILWIYVRGPYGYGITYVASKFTAGVKNARLEDVTIAGNTIVATFSPLRQPNSYVDVPVSLSVYTTNVPLILSLLIALFAFISRRKRAYAEALLILLLFHLLYVSFSELLQLTNTFMMRGIEETSLLRLSNYHFLWGLAEHASMSFAPFLIVVYIFVRFRKDKNAAKFR